MALSAAPAKELSTAWQLGTERRRLLVLTTLVILLSLLAVRLVLQLQLVAVVLLFGLILVGAVLYQPRLGLYTAFGLVLLFEPGGPDLLMEPGTYLFWGLQSTLGLKGLIVSPLEMILLLTILTQLLTGLSTHRLGFRGGRLFGPMALFALALVFGLMRGLANGWDPSIGLWEVRSFLILIVCYILATNLIRTTSQVRALLALLMFSVGIFAIEGVYRRLFLINTKVITVGSEGAWSHETVIFLTTLILLPIALFVGWAPLWQRLCAVLICPVAIFTLLASERRAGQIALIVSFLAYALVFLMSNRKAFCLLVVPILVGGLVYLPIFWNSAGLVGQPARAVRSLFAPDQRDADSNGYRDLERINIRATILANPIFGVGFGREFQFVVPVPDLSFWQLWRFQPHNNIFWVWLKTGFFGFVVFWVLMGRSLGLAAYSFRTLAQPDTKAFALVALAGVVGTLTFCYVDLGFTSSRVMVFLGTLLGTLAVLDRIDKSSIQAHRA